MKDQSTEVLVIGAGPVGLTLALDLARRGIQVRVVEKASGPATESRALAIHPRTLGILEQLGVGERVHAEGRLLHGARFMAGARELAHIRFDHLDGPFPYTVTLEQSRTERILASRLAEFGVEVEWNTRLVDLAQTSRGVNATVEAGDASKTIEAQYLVGCDGARSAVRARLGLTYEGVTGDERYLLADCRIDFRRAYDEEEMVAFLGDRSRLLFGALRAPLWRVIITLPNDDRRMPDGEPTLAGMQEIIDTDHAEAGLDMHDATWLSNFKVNTRMVDRFRVGRCFVAGDAAHIHSPSGGQGMNTGMQDAYNLAWKLAAAVRGATDPEVLLDSYEAERKPVAAQVLRATRLVDFFITGHRDKFFRKMRDGILPLLTSLEAVQDLVPRAIAGGEVHYRGSPIVEADVRPVRAARPGTGGRAGASRAFRASPVALLPGDLAPDARQVSHGGGERKRLYALLAQDVRPQAFLFPAQDASAARLSHVGHQLARLKEAVAGGVRPLMVLAPGQGDDRALGDDVLVDHAGDMARRYGAGGECLILVRPDGYVGFRSEPISVGALLSHLSGPGRSKRDGALATGDRGRVGTPEAGRPLQGLPIALAAVYGLAGAAKLAGPRMAVDRFDGWGYPRGSLQAIGAVEVAGAAGLAVPRLRPYAAAGLLGLLGGAIATHVSNREIPYAVPALALFLATASVLLRPGRTERGRA